MSETSWLLVVGIIAPFVIQGIKAVMEKINGVALTDKASLNLTYIVAIIAAAVGKFLSGEAVIPQGDLSVVVPLLITQVGLVLASATVVFKALLSKTTSIRA